MEGKVQFYFESELDLSFIEDTFLQSFGRKLDKEYWEWRFLNNPNDSKVYICYIIENNELASYYAVSPCTISIEGVNYKIALSNMTMTHPNHQGKGYFKLIANKLYNQLKNDGYIGVFGFANANSHYGFRKYLDWHDLSVLNTFQVDSKSYRSFLLKNYPELSFYKSKADKNHINSISDLEFCKTKIFLTRDYENMKWRILDNSENEYHTLQIFYRDSLAGIILFKYYGNDIDIMEFFYSSKIAIKSEELLSQGINGLIRGKDIKLNVWSNLHSAEHLYLEKLGFQEKNFNAYFGIIPFIKNNDLLDFSNWHYRFMDSDIY